MHSPVGWVRIGTTRPGRAWWHSSPDSPPVPRREIGLPYLVNQRFLALQDRVTNVPVEAIRGAGFVGYLASTDEQPRCRDRAGAAVVRHAYLPSFTPGRAAAYRTVNVTQSYEGHIMMTPTKRNASSA